MKTVTISVDDDTHHRTRIRAAEMGTSLSALVRGLGRRARDLIADPSVLLAVSIVSIWEISVKWRVDRHPRPGSDYAGLLGEEDVGLLPVTPGHLQRLEQLPLHHRDPFDHLIIAQAQCEEAVILTSDQIFTAYDVRCLPAIA